MNTNKSKVYQVNNEEFKNIIKNSLSYSDCLRALGLDTKGGSSTDVLKRRIKELNCSVEHFKGKSVSSTKYKLEDILVENSPYTSINKLKSRLIKEGLLKYKCCKCGITEWQNEPISLQLDHINGINNDHRLENLRFLCPNCHSQTDTYAGRNKKKSVKNYCNECGIEISTNAILCKNCANKERSLKQRKIERPSKETLLNQLKQSNMTNVGKYYGVSDNAIRKWLKFYNLPTSIKEIKNL